MLARPIEENDNHANQPFNGHFPTPDELRKIAENPEKFNCVFRELDAWFVRDRAEAAKQAQIQSTDRKWFGSDRTPSMEEMLDRGGRNLEEMLQELNRMESAS